eukprot:MONOS_13639.1-p1 / transcript=MONOS_13639.1 / gene=MONOS_13639 / organism=Monocercomonoides_exilis_PA203 / gene_product=peptidyl prolyl cis trans isomerase-like / transcript_product=peptidyl prolyl cis trans isomerase-like / location=Mono_scaffold00856:25702-26542(+) / protein_length=239 / sequence_SO=supercontig / SO=protein_coding / is_pseudo=false
MSNIYLSEPATTGTVKLVTNHGDIVVELWAKEAPKACRNFIQHCLTGYYDNTIFHRIVKGFCIQGGDPTGTGEGGESIYGKPFALEFHSRLKFNHRGIVAMATPASERGIQEVNLNGSQFFITLDKCEWLDRMHTIFGKVSFDTIFTVTTIGEVECDAHDRPFYPPKLLRAEVITNPFGGMENAVMVPRPLSKEELAAQQEKMNEIKNNEKKKEAERQTVRGTTRRDAKLLSFAQIDDE